MSPVAFSGSVHYEQGYWVVHIILDLATVGGTVPCEMSQGRSSDLIGTLMSWPSDKSIIFHK